jgi:ATP-dependent 26S proteasome regulatory subunit
MNLTRGINLKKIADMVRYPPVIISRSLTRSTIGNYLFNISQMTNASGAEIKAVCTEAGMFALRERRVHVTQEDFEMAVAKVMKKDSEKNMSLRKLWK